MKRKLISIVEGHGEVTAMPVLLRKLLQHHQIYDVQVPEPIRRKRGELSRCDGLVRWIEIARGEERCAGIVVILDADEDCAATLGPQLRQCAQERAGDIPVYVILPVREYESWLLASMATLAGKAGLVAAPVAPEKGPEVVDAKGWSRR